MKTTTIVIASVLALLLLPTLALAEQVTFNGEFINGTTLFSDSKNVSGFIYGRDVYPTTPAVIRERVCAVENETVRKNVCSYETIGFRNQTRKTCNRWSCETTVYQIPIQRRVCHIEESQVSQQVCRYVTRAEVRACLNPLTGVYTNQLPLSTFSYAVEGNETWLPVPYMHSKVFINGSVVFRVDIPNECSPKPGLFTEPADFAVNKPVSGVKSPCS